MAEFKDISIQKKLVLIQVATAFFAVLICCVIFVYNNIKVFTETSIASKNSIAEIVGINAAPTLEFNDHDAANAMLLKLNSNPSILNAIILDKNGKEFARYDKDSQQGFIFPTPGKKKTMVENFYEGKFIVSYRIIDKDFVGTVMLRAEITEFWDIVLGYLKIAAAILIASLAVAFIISALLQRSITHRLLSVVNKTRQVAETGNYSIRVPVGGSDEIGTLSEGFNNMLEQIEKQNSEIRSLNQNLEEKVLRRTRELELANNELEAFSYSVSHDLRAPLRAISGFTNVLKDEYSPNFDGEGNRLLNMVIANSEKMGHLIDDLLAFSKLGRKELVKSLIDMNELTESVLSELTNSMPNNAEVHVAPLGYVMADEALIRQVLTNLVSNAIKYSSKKENPVVEIGLTETNSQMVYSVHDNGAGFDMQFVNKLFGVFHRLHSDKDFPGTGVGLAIVQRIINKHGGKVWAEGKVGLGATFYFSLPKINNT